MSPSGSRFDGRIAVLAAFAAAVCLRAPGLVSAPRFWGEEGSVYFAHAMRSGFAGAVVAPHLDYLAVWANLATAVAALFPLESAPAVTLVFALAVQALPAAVILWSPAPIWGTAVRRAVCAAAVLLVPIASPNWLTTIGSHFWFSLVAALLLAEEPDTLPAAGRRVRRALLLLCALSGPPTAFVAPVYAVRAWRSRRREEVVQAAVICAGAAVQAAIWVFARTAGDAAGYRTPGIDPATAVLAVALKIVVLPVVGLSHASDVQLWISRAGREGSAVWYVLAAASAGLLALGARRLGAGSPPRARLLAAAALVAFLSAACATGLRDKSQLLDVDCGARYFHVPAALVVLALASFAEWRTGATLASRAAAAAVACSLAFGVARFRADMDPLVARDFPPWRDEVAAWRADPRRLPRAWPPGFVVALDPPASR